MMKGAKPAKKCGGGEVEGSGEAKEEEMSVTKASVAKVEDQVMMKRSSSLCERRFFFPIDVEFMKGGRDRGQRLEGSR